MDSSVSPTHGEQEMSAWNGHFACTCYHPLFVFNQFGDLERCSLRPGNVHSADGWDGVLKPVVVRYRGNVSRIYFRADAGFANPEVYEYLEAEGVTGEPCPAREDCISADAAGRTTSERDAAIPREFHLAAPGDRQGRVASGGTLSACRLYSHQHEPPGCARRCFSTTSAGRASNGSKRARGRSSGHGCHAGHSPPTRCVCSFMRSPTISAISCARWRRRSRSRTGR